MQEGASNGVLMPLPPAACEDNVLDGKRLVVRSMSSNPAHPINNHCIVVLNEGHFCPSLNVKLYRGAFGCSMDGSGSRDYTDI